MDCHGIIHMDAWQDIGIRVRRINKGNNICKYICVRKMFRAHLLCVRKEIIDQKAGAHAQDQRGGAPIVIFQMFPLKKEEQ